MTAGTTLFGITRPPDFVIGGGDQPYLRRWWLIPRNRWFNVYLHQFLRSDDDRAQHDHPWCNVSILLRGQYLEHAQSGAPRLRRAGSVVFRRPTTRHIIELAAGECWTLFITGPTVREWGFWCEGTRFVPWRDFTAPSDKGQIGKGCAE
jgi:hypothetical protein